MSKRLVCCPSIDEASIVSFRYLYVDSINLQVVDVTDSLAPLCKELRAVCCLDSLVEYGFGEKALDEKLQDALPFDFRELNSFELFKNMDELRLKTGSEKLLYSCLLSYYRREYDGTQQHTFFSEPASNSIPRDGVEHELTLESRTFVKTKEEEYVPETLDKGKTMAEKEAEAAAAQAQAELEQARAEAEAKEQKKEARDKKRKQMQARRAVEAYREFRNQDDIHAEQYQRLRKYEEEMRANNDYLATEYAAGNYASLPGYIPAETFAQAFESIENETIRCSYNPSELFAVASRLDEFGIDYTVVPEQGIDGSVRGCVCYTSEQAEPALRAIEFFELEKQLYLDNAISSCTFLNAFQLQAMDFAYENYVDTSFVSSGHFSGNQMFRILEAGLDGYDMSVLANPSYSPAQMDAINHFMRQGWDTASICEPGMPMAAIADNIFRAELSHGVPESNSFFNSHSYDEFIAYDKRDNFGDYSNGYDSAHRKELYSKSEQLAQDAKDRFQAYKDNVRASYEYSQKEMNYVPGSQNIDNTPSVNNHSPATPVVTPLVAPVVTPSVNPVAPVTPVVTPGVSSAGAFGSVPGKGSEDSKFVKDSQESTRVKANKADTVTVVGKDGRSYIKNPDGTLRDVSGKVHQLDKSGQPVPVNNYSFGSSYTPSGRTRADGSYESTPKYRRTDTPTPGNNRSTDYTEHKNQQKTPQGANPMRARKMPLDELRVRTSFAERDGARIQRFGSQALQTGSRFAMSSVRMAINNMTRSDETGTMSTAHKFGRNAALVAHLVVDLPRMFARSGQGVSYTANAVQGAQPNLAGKVNQSQNSLPLRVKPREEKLSAAEKAYSKSLRKEFGEKAARFNLREIDKQISVYSAALSAEKDKLLPVNRQIKAQLKTLHPAAILSVEKKELISKNQQLKAEIKALQAKPSLSAAEKQVLEKKIQKKLANEKLIGEKVRGINKDLIEKNRLIRENKQLKSQIQSLQWKKDKTPADRELLKKLTEKKTLNEKVIGQKSKVIRTQNKVIAKDTRTARKLLNQKRQNEVILAAHGKKIKSLNRLKKRKLGIEKDLKELGKNLKAARAAEGRLKSLPGRLVEKVIQKLYESGDHTLTGLGQATSFAMTFSRSPITRLSFRFVRAAVRKVATKVKSSPKGPGKAAPAKVKPEIKPKTTPKGRAKPPVRATGTKSGLHNKATRKVGVKGEKQIKRLFGQQKGIKLWIKQSAQKLMAAAKAAAKSLMAMLGGGSTVGAAGGGAAAAGAAAGGPVLVVILIVVVLALVIGLVSSFVVTDKQTDDGRIDLSEYIGYINDCQDVLQEEINSIANGFSSETGKQYDNVFYDYNGEGNTLQILSMAYVRFGLDLTNKEAAMAYIEQLYHDSNFVDYAESDLYACANGCVERNYYCYDEYDEYASQTRISLYTASDGKGCIESPAYSCDVEGIIGTHNNGNAMDAPCSCGDCKEETTMVESGHYVYYCQGYISGYENVNGQKYPIQAFHSPAGVPMDSPCACSNCKKEQEMVAVTQYFCQGYSGETYSFDGCEFHNNGNAMSSPCSCDDYETDTEIEWVTQYFCQGYYEYHDGDEVFYQHNDGEAMDYPCSCDNCDESEIPESVTYYYCQGYCPGNHHDYTCAGHKENICYGEHQDVTITITSLGFDDIFYADSSLASAGSYIMGDAYEDKFTVTAYCACSICCGDNADGITASGTVATANHTIAVDPDVIPMGTHVWINGKEYVAEDTGSAINGNRIDIFFDSHQQARNWGTRKLTVYKSATVSSDSEELDEYGFAGWTEDNIELVKGIYDGLTNDDAKEIYAGLDGIVSLSYGTGNNNFDFSGLVFDEMDIDSLTRYQKAILSVIENNSVETKKGYCQAWVADVYLYAGTGARASKCCANHAGEAWGVSNDWSNIQVGATIYGYSSSKYGHVGIYISNGMVAHNIGYVKVESLERWVKTYNGQCWGWNGAYNLSGNSAYNCKPAGTFMRGKD